MLVTLAFTVTCWPIIWMDLIDERVVEYWMSAKLVKSISGHCSTITTSPFSMSVVFEEMCTLNFSI